MKMLTRFPGVGLVMFALVLSAASAARAAGANGDGAPATSPPVAKPDTYAAQEGGNTGAGVAQPTSSSPENWKGNPSLGTGSFSALIGLGVIDDYRPGFSLVGAVSKKVLERGFISDLNDEVFVEGEFGPVLVAGNAAWFYSAHMRWDFIYDPQWTFYALAGLGGSIQGDYFGDHFVLLPRFGVGALLAITDQVGIRAEISQNLMVVGANIPF